MRQIRILNIITRLERGGAPMALLEVIRRLGNDFQVDLVTGQTDDPDLDFTHEVSQWGIDPIVVSSLRRNPHPRDLIAIWELRRIIRAGHYDLVHTHTSKAGFLGRIAARLCEVPAVVHSPHGTILEGYFSPTLTRFYALLEKITARFTHRIIGLTALEIEQYLAAGIGRRDQYTYIYNGIDIDAFARASKSETDLRSELGIPRDAALGITVGRLVQVKGQRDLLKALVSDAARNLHILLVGEGELREELQALAHRLDIASRVHFLGWRTDVASLLAQSDLFVLPSHNEGLGLVLIEAMALRLPIVATHVGGVPEVVDDETTGLLVPPQMPGRLAEAMARLIEDPALRTRMGNAGYERAVAQFSIQATVRQTETLYRTLAGAAA